MHLRKVAVLIFLVVLSISPRAAWAAQKADARRPSPPPAGEDRMPAVVEQYTADRMGLTRVFPLGISPAHVARFEKFYTTERAMRRHGLQLALSRRPRGLCAAE